MGHGGRAGLGDDYEGWQVGTQGQRDTVGVAVSAAVLGRRWRMSEQEPVSPVGPLLCRKRRLLPRWIWGVSGKGPCHRQACSEPS